MSLTPIASKKKVVTPAKSKQVRETSTNSSSNDPVAIEIDISASDNQDVKLNTPGAKKIFSNSPLITTTLALFLRSETTKPERAIHANDKSKKMAAEWNNFVQYFHDLHGVDDTPMPSAVTYQRTLCPAVIEAAMKVYDIGKLWL